MGRIDFTYVSYVPQIRNNHEKLVNISEQILKDLRSAYQLIDNAVVAYGQYRYEDFISLSAEAFEIIQDNNKHILGIYEAILNEELFWKEETYNNLRNNPSRYN